MNADQLIPLIFGRLTPEALPLHEPILVVTMSVVLLGGLALFGAFGPEAARLSRLALTEAELDESALQTDDERDGLAEVAARWRLVLIEDAAEARKRLDANTDKEQQAALKAQYDKLSDDLKSEYVEAEGFWSPHFAAFLSASRTNASSVALSPSGPMRTGTPMNDGCSLRPLVLKM